MVDIRRFRRQPRDEHDAVSHYAQATNWPLVYILLEDAYYKNCKQAYVGQSDNFIDRLRSHEEDKQALDLIHTITDNDFNLSVTKDLEALLIQYLASDSSGYELLNRTQGISFDIDYYDREKYRAKFNLIWQQLQEKLIVEQSLDEIENSALFKYSPFKTLNDEQRRIVNSLVGSIENASEPQLHLVDGFAGSGKTVLSIYLLKKLREERPDLRLGLVFPMPSLRNTMQRIVKRVPQLDRSMIIGPHDVIHQRYDVLIVDEAHRLKHAQNTQIAGQFYHINQLLNLPEKEGTQLDWIRCMSTHQILFYDADQTVSSSDISSARFTQLQPTRHHLHRQMRTQAGPAYLSYIKKILTNQAVQPRSFINYELRFFDNLKYMQQAIVQRHKDVGLSKLIAGVCWPWTSRNDKQAIDINIDGVSLTWNRPEDYAWPAHGDTEATVGRIHTIQGYDLNYAGVIIGPDLDYDEQLGQIIVRPENNQDSMSKRGVHNPEQLATYIRNIYENVLLTRGILGTYVYVVSPRLRRHLKPFFDF